MTYAMTLLGGAAPGGHYEWRNTLRQEPRETRGVLDWPPSLTGGGPYEAPGAHGPRHRRLPRNWSRDRAGARRGRRRRRHQLRLERAGRQGGCPADPEDGPPLGDGAGRCRRLPRHGPNGAGPPQEVRPP